MAIEQDGLEDPRVLKAYHVMLAGRYSHLKGSQWMRNSGGPKPPARFVDIPDEASRKSVNDAEDPYVRRRKSIKAFIRAQSGSSIGKSVLHAELRAGKGTSGAWPATGSGGSSLVQEVYRR